MREERGGAGGQEVPCRVAIGVAAPHAPCVRHPACSETHPDVALLVHQRPDLVDGELWVWVGRTGGGARGRGREAKGGGGDNKSRRAAWPTVCVALLWEASGGRASPQGLGPPVQDRCGRAHQPMPAGSGPGRGMRGGPAAHGRGQRAQPAAADRGRLPLPPFFPSRLPHGARALLRVDNAYTATHLDHGGLVFVRGCTPGSPVEGVGVGGGERRWAARP